jgi:DNA recombination-dependent growth factor C
MSLIKGSVTLTRYLVVDDVPELDAEFVADRLKHHAFQDIENGAEEESMGWVEILRTSSADFDPITLKFGDVLALAMRLDTRKVPAKTVNRYFALALAEAEAEPDQKLGPDKKRELKARVRLDLLSRTPVATDVFEVCWLQKSREVWLAAAGTKIRERFEELWRRTFGLGLIMKIPFVLAQNLAPAGTSAEALDQIRPSAFFGHGEG